MSFNLDVSTYCRTQVGPYKPHKPWDCSFMILQLSLRCELSLHKEHQFSHASRRLYPCGTGKKYFSSIFGSKVDSEAITEHLIFLGEHAPTPTKLLCAYTCTTIALTTFKNPFWRLCSDNCKSRWVKLLCMAPNYLTIWLNIVSKVNCDIGSITKEMTCRNDNFWVGR